MWNSSSGSARGIPHFQMKTICRQGEKPINPHVVILSLPASGCRPKTSLILTTNRNFIVYHLFDGVLRFDCVYRFNNPSPTFINPLPPPRPSLRSLPVEAVFDVTFLCWLEDGLKTAWRRLEDGLEGQAEWIGATFPLVFQVGHVVTRRHFWIAFQFRLAAVALGKLPHRPLSHSAPASAQSLRRLTLIKVSNQRVDIHLPIINISGDG